MNQPVEPPVPGLEAPGLTIGPGSPERREPVSLAGKRKTIDLPPGMTSADWGYERRSWQNPRIRGLLKCLRLLDHVSESDFAILHCSVRRLFEIQGQLLDVSKALRTELMPFLDSPSKVPSLETARCAAVMGMEELSREILQELDGHSLEVSEEGLSELRRFLCAALDEVTNFVRNTLSRLVAGDPRSEFDVDYFVSRRFSKDIDNAEWLYSSVCGLEEYVREFNLNRRPALVRCADKLESDGKVPDFEYWASTGSVLDVLLETVVPMLRSVAAIPGTRLDELELLGEMTDQICGRAKILLEIFSLAQMISGLEGKSTSSDKLDDDRSSVAIVAVCRRLAELLYQLSQHIQNLDTFTVIWRRGISQRRALLLTRDDHLEE